MYFDKQPIVTAVISEQETKFRDIYIGAEYYDNEVEKVKLQHGIRLPYIAWKLYDNKECWYAILLANPEYMYPLDFENEDSIEIRLPKFVKD